MASARPAAAIGSERIERDELHSPYNPRHQMRGREKQGAAGEEGGVVSGDLAGCAVGDDGKGSG